MKKGYVAFLDVLGFSALVARDDTGKKLSEYQEQLDLAVSDKVGPLQPARYVVFSDSIVITVAGEDYRAFHSIVVRCAGLFGRLLEADVAVRGAIAYGNYVEHPTGNGVFVAGPALVDAYHYETRQDWVGIMICPSAIEQNPDLGQRCNLETPHESESDRYVALSFACSVSPYPYIPFHKEEMENNNGFEGFAITPNAYTYTPGAMKDFLGEAGRKMEWLKAIAPGPEEQAKYRLARDFFNLVEGQWNGRIAAATI